MVILLFLAACFLAFSNGTNDNFKGEAMLFGSGTVTGKANYKTFSGILLSWLLTLHVAVVCAGLSYWLLTTYFLQ
ncbi:hypothetical protein [Pontibacter akesuensis]|uniref:hypothetical protein n=1 Tax=Pontibacter akesuensis TaxID=388950 RepID=UPI00083A5FC6|nr:hypothetical protein [Pontibacter akesuensis]GHA60295.1 hypothetical protein GCM10007389_10670 [Pontibacter akesuensis]